MPLATVSAILKPFILRIYHDASQIISNSHLLAEVASHLLSMLHGKQTDGAEKSGNTSGVETAAGF